MSREASIESGRRTAQLEADEAGIAEAAAIIRAGGLTAFPTETVYGLGADATDPRAIAALYAAKERPRFNPLIAHVADINAARRHGLFDEAAARLAELFWPGPLTLVVPLLPESPICDLARAGLPSVALRVPAHPVATSLLGAVGRPVAAPSANRSGRISPTRASHVLATLEGRIDAVLDGGTTAVGVESTIVACLDDGPVLLRPGGIARGTLEHAIGAPLRTETTKAGTMAPGSLPSHYAPRALVRLDAERIELGEAALLFGEDLPGTPGSVAARNLSPRRDLAEAAANLFAALHELDASGASTIAVAAIPERELGEAINDRLRRAAAERAAS